MNVRNVFALGFLVATAGIAGLVACSSDDSTPSSSSTSSSSGSTTGEETVTVRVSAAAGGTVADKEGKAKLDIPAGALEKDTDITLKLTAKSGAAVVDIADFGPDGLKFLKPATLALKADASLAPAGKSLAVAIGDGASFTAIAGSTYANGVATANVEHFTKFTIIVVDGKTTLVDPSSCQDARSKFSPCGGDPTGTWLFADFCPDPAKTKVPDPFNGKCTQLVSSIEVTNTQEITITSSTTSGSAGTVTLKFISDFPVQCIIDATDGGVSQCADYGGSGNPCVDKGGGQCHCESSQSSEQAADTTPKGYTTSGSKWTSASGESGQYCVSGDIIYYLSDPGDSGSSNLLYVLKRK